MKKHPVKKQIFLLYFTVFTSIVGFAMIFPILPLFAETLHATTWDIGIIAASFSFAQFLGAPFLGRLSDRFGRKPIVLFSISASVIALLIIAFAKNLETIILSRLLHGLATAGNFPIVQAYIADITSKEERAEYMGKVSAMFSLGFVFGPAIGGILGSLGFALAFLVAAGISFLNLIFVYFALPESITQKAEKFVLREGLLNLKGIYNGLRGDFGVLFFLLFSWAYYVSNFQVAIPLFTQQQFSMGSFGNGMFFSAVGIASTITQWFLLPKVIKLFGELRTILIGICLMILGQFFAPFSQQAMIFYLCFIISVIGSGLKRPTVNVVLSKATHEGQGTTMGLAFSFESLGRVFGPIIAGFVIAPFGLASPFWLTTIVLILGLLLFWRVEMQKPR